MTFDVAQLCFSLPDSFLKTYKNKQPDWGPLGFFTFKRTYARKIEGEDRTEEYWETCRRVVEGTFSIQKNHCKRNHLPWNERKAQRTAKRMFELMWDFKFLPPGRGMWAMGTEYVAERGGACLNNCAFVSTKDIAEQPTKWAMFIMDMSMVGVGVGFDTKGADKLSVSKPAFYNVNPDTGEIDSSWVVPDTREGWVEALELLIKAYTHPEENGEMPVYDFSQVREAGLPIKGFGGTSSGPEPLKEMLEDIQAIFEGRIGQKLTSADIVDIGNLIGRCVVAGNVRRSAEIVFGEPDDKEFSLLKQDQEKLIHHRWASNNSIFASIGMDYSWHAQQTAVNGEPGYMWLNNACAYGRMKDAPDWADRDAVGGNPCLEQTLHNYELCTLVETFPARHNNLDEYLETLKIAYLYAKTVTLIPTHWPETNAIMAKNRRIGLSQSGIIKAFGKHGRRAMMEWCDKGYEFISGLDIQYSNWLGIPKSIKKTSVKPSGTISLLPGEPPGIHYPHSEFYIRRIRVGIHSSLAAAATKAGYHVESAIGQEESTVVVSFPVKEEFFRRGKNDVSIWEQVANAVAYQRFWADNQVSVTITFKPEEQDDIKHILELYEDSLKGISFLPISEHGYEQAPYEEISEEVYNSMTKDINAAALIIDNDDVAAPRFCDGDTCEL
jgi:adenosylcobalamin-dependent ribonucleoside-triphosphate reductase